MLTEPGPWRITFDTNPDDCNFTCIMCEDHSPYSSTQSDRKKAPLPRRRMSIDLVEKLLRESQGTPLQEIIPSTMGEPLLYRQFDRIILLCHAYGLKLNLTTNGSFPGKFSKDSLEKMKHLLPSLNLSPVETWAHLLVPITSDIKISWNGATKKTHEEIMRGSVWENVIDNLKTLVSIRNRYEKENRCRLTLQLTFLETNIHELADIVRLAAKMGIDRVKGHHLWAHFAEILPLSMRRNPESIDRWNQAVKQAKQAAQENPLPNGVPVLLENIYELDRESSDDIIPDGICPFLGKEAWIATDGRFNPCCAPDLQRRKLGEFGNVNDLSITEIWKSKAYQDLCKNYKQNAVCKHCNMRKKPEQVLDSFQFSKSQFAGV